MLQGQALFTVAALYFFQTPQLARDPVAGAPGIGACQWPVSVRAHPALSGYSWLSALLLWGPVTPTEIKVSSQQWHLSLWSYLAYDRAAQSFPGCSTLLKKPPPS